MAQQTNSTVSRPVEAGDSIISSPKTPTSNPGLYSQLEGALNTTNRFAPNGQSNSDSLLMPGSLNYTPPSLELSAAKASSVVPSDATSGTTGGTTSGNSNTAVMNDLSADIVDVNQLGQAIKQYATDQQSGAGTTADLSTIAIDQKAFDTAMAQTITDAGGPQSAIGQQLATIQQGLDQSLNKLSGNAGVKPGDTGGGCGSSSPDSGGGCGSSAHDSGGGCGSSSHDSGGGCGSGCGSSDSGGGCGSGCGSSDSGGGCGSGCGSSDSGGGCGSGCGSSDSGGGCGSGCGSSDSGGGCGSSSHDSGGGCGGSQGLDPFEQSLQNSATTDQGLLNVVQNAQTQMSQPGFADLEQRLKQDMQAMPGATEQQILNQAQQQLATDGFGNDAQILNQITQKDVSQSGNPTTGSSQPSDAGTAVSQALQQLNNLLKQVGGDPAGIPQAGSSLATQREVVPASPASQVEIQPHAQPVVEPVSKPSPEAKTEAKSEPPAAKPQGT